MIGHAPAIVISGGVRAALENLLRQMNTAMRCDMPVLLLPYGWPHASGLLDLTDSTRSIARFDPFDRSSSDLSLDDETPSRKSMRLCSAFTKGLSAREQPGLSTKPNACLRSKKPKQAGRHH